MAAVITGTLFNASAYAAEEIQEFSLDPMIVTATKVETKSLDVPAAVEVFDRTKIEESGAGNAFDVLRNTLGVISHAQGVNGMSMGAMTSRIVIRGVEKGTLVLVNGVPLNQDGKYNLEDIPAEAIEKIEVVKGGGSVLYGSEATGGVINIITKKKNVKNSIKVEAGNYGKERYAANIHADKLTVIANYQNKGSVSNYAQSTSKVYEYVKGSQKSIYWNYDINDALSFSHSFAKNEHKLRMTSPKTGKMTDSTIYSDEDQSFLLKYDKDEWKGHLSYGTQAKSYYKDVYANKYLYSWRKGHNVNFDLNKSTEIGAGKLLVGVGYQREDMDLYAYNKGPFDSTYKRNIASIYASYDWKVSDNDNIVVNARETWARNIIGSQHNLKKDTYTRSDNGSLKKFTPELQYVHKLSEDSRLYAKAGKSFRLPELTKIYGSGSMVSKLDLKPEQGTHYEIGYKKDFKKASVRFDVFHFKIKDSISLVSGNPIDGNCVYENTDFKNTGVELSGSFKFNDNWSSDLGFIYQKPQQQDNDTYGDNSWHDMLNKYQVLASVKYNKSKFNSMVSVNFVGDRTGNDAKQGHLKPQCFTDLHMAYKPADNHKLFFHLNNIFDRKDWTNSGTPGGSSAYYYNLGRNFMVGYEYSF